MHRVTLEGGEIAASQIEVVLVGCPLLVFAFFFFLVAVKSEMFI